MVADSRRKKSREEKSPDADRKRPREDSDFVDRLPSSHRILLRREEVLARHMARLGPCHGRGLQEAVAKFWRCEGPHFENRLETYRKLHKNTSYFVGDSAVKMKMVTKIERTSVQRTETNEETAASGTEEMLRTSEIRFAHNDNTELFKDRSGSILETAVQLLSGAVSADAIPVFEVCLHESKHYAKTGNRRLAAFRLAQLFAPERFSHVRVKLAQVNQVFLVGVGNGRAKLTTKLNGPECEGKWMFIKETQERVGITLDEHTYGRDLLELLLPGGTNNSFHFKVVTSLPSGATALAIRRKLASRKRKLADKGKLLEVSRRKPV